MNHDILRQLERLLQTSVLLQFRKDRNTSGLSSQLSRGLSFLSRECLRLNVVVTRTTRNRLAENGSIPLAQSSPKPCPFMRTSITPREPLRCPNHHLRQLLHLTQERSVPRIQHHLIPSRPAPIHNAILQTRRIDLVPGCVDVQPAAVELGGVVVDGRRGGGEGGEGLVVELVGGGVLQGVGDVVEEVEGGVGDVEEAGCVLGED